MKETLLSLALMVGIVVLSAVVTQLFAENV